MGSTEERRDIKVRFSPSQTLWVSVAEGAIFHITNVALYHLHADQYDSDIGGYLSLKWIYSSDTDYNQRTISKSRQKYVCI